MSFPEFSLSGGTNMFNHNTIASLLDALGALTLVTLFDLILYVNNSSVMLGRVFLGRTSTKL